MKRFGSFYATRKSIIIDAIIMLLFGLLSVTWFRGDFLISAGDFVFLPNGLQTATNSLYLWNTWGPNVGVVSLIPYDLFRVSTYFVGLSTVISEKVWFYLSFSFSCFSMYYLTSTLVEGNKRRLTSLLSAFFYSMIPYVVGSNFLLPTPTTTLFYSSVPLILALYIRGINKRSGFGRIFMICLVWTLTATSAYIDFPYAIVTWIFLCLYYIFYIVLNNSNRSKVVSATRFTFSLLALWILINLYWLLPVLSQSSSIFQGASVSGTSPLNWLYLWSAHLIDVMRLRGSFSLSLSTQGSYYAPWYVVYSSNIFVIISFMFPIVAFASIFFARKNNYVLYFSLLALFGFFFINGPYSPLGEITVWLYNAFWPLQIFRSVYLRFLPMITMSYAFLIGYVLGQLCPNNLWGKLKAKTAPKLLELSKLVSVVLLIFVLFGVYLYPVWTGEIIFAGSGVIPSARVEIPSYYSSASNWLNKDNGEYNIMSLPMSNINGYEEFSWDSGYAGAGLTSSLLNKPIIGSGDIDNGLSSFVANQIVDNSSEGIAQILSLMQVKYVLLHNDADWQLIKEPNYGGFIYTSQANFHSILNSFSGLHLEQSFGELDFYKNQYPLVPKIYSTPYATFISGSFDQLAAVTGREDFVPNETVFLLSQDLNSIQYSTIRNEWGAYNETPYSTEALAGFYVPENGNYTILVRVPSLADVANSTFNVRIDAKDTTFYPIYANTDQNTLDMNLYSTPIYLSKGYHSLTMTSGTLISNPPEVEDIQLSPLIMGENKPQNIIINSNSVPDALTAYQEINPTQYVLHINASNPFFLTFTETYDNNWIAYANGQQIPAEYHFTTNGFANGWYITKTGTYTLTLEFAPQNLFYAGAAISITSLIICTAYVSKNKIKNIYQRHIKKNKVNN